MSEAVDPQTPHAEAPDPALADPEDELAELTRALRAHAEWHRASGTSGLPRSSAGPERTQEREPAPSRSPAVPRSPRRHPASPPTGSSSSVGPPVATSARTSLPAVAGPLADVPERLRLLAEEVAACTACGLHRGRKQTVFARGTGSSRLCFFGEGPGAEEDEQGLPFVGKAGQLLDRMIAAMGFERDEVYVCNVVKCRPPDNRKPEPEEIASCARFYEQQIELINPEVIVALGATAYAGLFGPTSLGITRLRGRIKLYKGRIAVMPTFHPAYLLRNPAAKADVWKDLKEVVRQMGRELPAKK